MPSRSSSKTPKSSANKISRSRRTPVAQSKSLRHNQRGFALLLVFLMAAVVAITLYMELPRVAMESQRDKEQTLIDRGEQYKRAIQLFVKKAGRYPGDIKELENFQNQRFLRHRYVDPMTGKDEWRQIHIANGVLTDSKVTKPTGPGGKEDPKTPNGFVGELAGLGGSQNSTQGGGASSVRDRRRTSDGANATMPGPALPGGGPDRAAARPRTPRRRPVGWPELRSAAVARSGAGQRTVGASRYPDLPHRTTRLLRSE